MKKILIILFVFGSLSAMAKTTEVVSVKGMVCSFCAQGITKKFKEQKEVEKVEVSLSDKKVSLTYKEGSRLNKEKIETLLKEAGYEVTGISQ